jgi:hypothetical protein
MGDRTVLTGADRRCASWLTFADEEGGGASEGENKRQRQKERR